MREELLDPGPMPEDGFVEGQVVDSSSAPGVRPRRLDEVVGHPELREHLQIILAAARRRGAPSSPSSTRTGDPG